MISKKLRKGTFIMLLGTRAGMLSEKIDDSQLTIFYYTESSGLRPFKLNSTTLTKSNTPNWNLVERIVVGPKVVSIEDGYYNMYQSTETISLKDVDFTNAVSLETIGSNAFRDTHIGSADKTLDLSNTKTNFISSTSAFDATDYGKVVLSPYTTNFGGFGYCSNLREIDFNNAQVSYINSNAAAGNPNLDTFSNFNQSAVLRVSNYAFYNSGLRNVNLNLLNCTFYEHSCFRSTGLPQVTITSKNNYNTPEVQDNSFNDDTKCTTNRTITFNHGNGNYLYLQGVNCFGDNKKVTSLTINNTFTRARNAFVNIGSSTTNGVDVYCNANLPTVTSNRYAMFSGAKINTFTMGPNVTSIPQYFLYNCSSINTLDISNRDVFYFVSSSTIPSYSFNIIVPDSQYYQYATSDYWHDHATIFRKSESPYIMPKTTVTLEKGDGTVVQREINARLQQSDVDSLVAEGFVKFNLTGVDMIGYGCFMNETTITELYLPDCRFIANKSLSGLTNVSNVITLSPNVIAIGQNVFENSTFTGINHGNLLNTRKQGTFLFNSMVSITELTLPSHILDYNNIVTNCTNIQTLRLPWQTCPTALISQSADPFGNTGTYCGMNTASQGINKLIVPVGSTGYDDLITAHPELTDPTKCGFTLQYGE